MRKEPTVPIGMHGLQKPMFDESLRASSHEVQALFCIRANENRCNFECGTCILSRMNHNAFRNHYKWNRSYE